jgi:uncharacterized protein (DUF305 family)
MEMHHAATSKGASKSHYRMLIVMTAISLITMFILMYAMVNSRENAYINWNQLYMAGLMTAAMVLIEVALMSGMYPNKRLNGIILGAGAVMLIVFWLFIRRQTAISDEQFLKSMIPHHAAAILMCEQASIHDADVKSLCQGIVTRQQDEINQMKTKLQELAK